MGGAVAAIEQGYMQGEMAAHAYEYQTDIEKASVQSSVSTNLQTIRLSKQMTLLRQI